MVWSHNQEVSVEFYCAHLPNKPSIQFNQLGRLSREMGYSFSLQVTLLKTPATAGYVQNFHFICRFRCVTFKIICQPHFGQNAFCCSLTRSVDSPNTHAHTQHRDSCRSCVRRQKPNIWRIDSAVIHRDFSIDVCGAQCRFHFSILICIFFSSLVRIDLLLLLLSVSASSMYFFIFEHQSIEIHVVFHRSLRCHSARHYCLHYSRVMCSIVVCGDVHFSTTSTIKRYVYVCHWSVYTMRTR